MIIRPAITARASFCAVAWASPRGAFSRNRYSGYPPLARTPIGSAAAAVAAKMIEIRRIARPPICPSDIRLVLTQTRRQRFPGCCHRPAFVTSCFRGPSSAMAGDRGRILVVDDDEGLRELLVRYLSDNGYDAAGVGDGAAMKRHLAVHPVDLLLLDVMLPGEDGLSLARTLNADGAPPIIMLSARG